jgi:archaellum biogenesis ATPase FlaH
MSQEEEKSEMSLIKKVFVFALLSGFLVMGIVSMKRAMPEAKEERIYKAIKAYSPYSLEKRIGGLTILDSRDEEFKEKPSAAELLHRVDELDKIWAKEHLAIEGSDIIITNDDGSSVKIFIETPKERAFIKSFFGI